MIARYVDFVCRRWVAILAVAALLVAAGAVVAVGLGLEAGLEALLPSGDPGAEALHDAERRMGRTSTLAVLVESPDFATNQRYAATLAPAIEALGPSLVETTVWHAPEVRRFFETHKWLYASLDLLRDVRDRLELEKGKRLNPLLVPLEEPPTLDELERRVRGTSDKMTTRFPSDVLASDKGDVVVIVVLPARGEAGNGADLGPGDDRLMRAVERVVERDPPPAGVVVRYGGTVASSVAERAAIEKDMALTSGVVTVLVCLVVWLYFGRVRAIPLMALPALGGATLALAAARVLFGNLNTSTAFLGSIIVGNGINYPILTLARYEEERRNGAPVRVALVAAVGGTARATLLASAAAATAYGSLALTHFRGFSQFGVIGGIGMLLCWLGAMTVLPALVWALDRKSPSVPRPWRANFGAPFARLAARAPVSVLAVAAVVTAVALARLPSWLRDPFDYDLRHVRTVNVEETEQLDPIVGRALSPSLLLAPSRSMIEAAAAKIRARAARSPHTVERVVTLSDLLPGTPAVQREKLALLDEIRRFADDPRLADLAPDQYARLQRLKPPPDLRPVGPADLPPLALRPFTERDGRLGRVALVFPPQQDFSVEDGRDLLRLARVVGAVPVRAPDGRTVVLHAAGRPEVFAALLRSIAHDGPRATAASLVGVALITFLVLRVRTGALAVLATLCLGVVWQVGIAALAGVKLNFLDFIALPITFGIGIDYAGNLIVRYQQDRPRLGDVAAAPDALCSTGGAVALNSLTTSLGYGSLLLAHNLAIRSFGALAILGEIACLSTALLVLPSLLVLRARRRVGSRARVSA